MDIFVFSAGGEDEPSGLERFAQRNFDAQAGITNGLTGRAYAVPATVGRQWKEVERAIHGFLEFAKMHPMNRYLLTPLGDGVFDQERVALLFTEALTQILFPGKWAEILGFPPRLLVGGGRDFDVQPLLNERLEIAMENIANATGWNPQQITLICGEARGADSMAKQWFLQEGMPVWSFPADWERQGKSAGFVRNLLMANFATHVLLFWDGESRGTASMKKIAEEKGLPLATEYY